MPTHYIEASSSGPGNIWLHKTKNRRRCWSSVYSPLVPSTQWNEMCKNQFHQRLRAACILLLLYLDAEGGGLWAGGLGGGGGLCGGLEQSFENGLGVHFGRGLRGGALAAGTGQRGRQAVFLRAAAAAASAWGVAESPVGQKRKKTDPSLCLRPPAHLFTSTCWLFSAEAPHSHLILEKT